MTKPASFTEVIDLWPSIEAAVSDIGATRSQVSKWRRRDSIPSEWWSAVLGTMVARNAGVDADLMVALAARPAVAVEAAEARP